MVFLGFNRKPFRGFSMSRLGALLLFYGDIVRIIPGVASVFLGDGCLGRRRVGVVVYEQPPFQPIYLLKQHPLDTNRYLKRGKYSVKELQQVVCRCAPVGAACAVWILARPVVGEDLPELALRRRDPMRNMQG